MEIFYRKEPMRIFYDMGALPVFRRPAVTVGSFDGVHRGHLFLLGVLRERAGALGGESIVVTFGDHPRRVLGSDEGLMELTPMEEKARLIEAAGIDNLIVMPFDTAVSQLPAEDFVRDFLAGRLGVRELVVGYNHKFGKNREGTPHFLGGVGEKYGFKIVETPQFSGGVGEKNEKISSTAIREALSRGDIDTAERMLGRKLG